MSLNRSGSRNSIDNCPMPKLSAYESSQVVEQLIRNQALRSPGSDSDEIETLPVATITARGSINNSGPANEPLNVLDGDFETSWSNKGIG